MKTLGNNNPHLRGTQTGSGINRQSGPFGRITISGQAGETIRIPLTELYPVSLQVSQGIMAQSIGGSVAIHITLVDPDLAMNPAQDAGGHWVPAASLAAGELKKLDPAFGSVIRVTFTTKAIVYLMGV